MNRLYFPGLNTLRLYAALCVLIFHTRNFPGSPYPWWVLDGEQAVTLFFVLSGFLISYLLLDERRRTGTIDVGAFYARRALRILPLYYLLIAFAALLPLLRPEPAALPLVLGFAAPVLHAAQPYSGLGRLEHLWSIGVEEVFYLFWPPLVKRVGLVRACAGVIALRLALTLLAQRVDPQSARLIEEYHFESMAVGGLAAWLVFERRAAIRLLYRPALAWGALVILGLMHINVLHPDTWIGSLVFATVIVNVATNPRFPKAEHPALAWWGQRTYGIYMWHYPLLSLVALFAAGPFLAAVTVPVTLAVTALSYRYFESPFLHLKARFGVRAVAAPAGN